MTHHPQPSREFIRNIHDTHSRYYPILPYEQKDLDEVFKNIECRLRVKELDAPTVEWESKDVSCWTHGHCMARTSPYSGEWISPEELKNQIDQINLVISDANKNGIKIIQIGRKVISHGEALHDHNDASLSNKIYFTIYGVKE